jgi:hemerythrin superfamily protein
MYEFTPRGWNKPITAKDEGELFKRVKQYYTETKERNVKKTANIIKSLKAA